MSKAAADYGVLLDEVDDLLKQVEDALVHHADPKPTAHDVDDLICCKGALRRAYFHLTKRKVTER